MPKDRVTNLHQGYGFVEFRSEEDADYVSDVVKPLSTSGFDNLKFIKHWDRCIDYIILFLLFSYFTGNQDFKHDKTVWKANTCE